MDKIVMKEEDLSSCISKIEARLGRKLEPLEREIAILSFHAGLEAYQSKILASLAAMKHRMTS